MPLCFFSTINPPFFILKMKPRLFEKNVKSYDHGKYLSMNTKLIAQ